MCETIISRDSAKPSLTVTPQCILFKIFLKSTIDLIRIDFFDQNVFFNTEKVMITQEPYILHNNEVHQLSLQ